MKTYPPNLPYPGQPGLPHHPGSGLPSEAIVANLANCQRQFDTMNLVQHSHGLPPPPGAPTPSTVVSSVASAQNLPPHPLPPPDYNSSPHGSSSVVAGLLPSSPSSSSSAYYPYNNNNTISNSYGQCQMASYGGTVTSSGYPVVGSISPGSSVDYSNAPTSGYGNGVPHMLDSYPSSPYGSLRQIGQVQEPVYSPGIVCSNLTDPLATGSPPRDSGSTGMEQQHAQQHWGSGSSPWSAGAIPVTAGTNGSTGPSPVEGHYSTPMPCFTTTSEGEMNMSATGDKLMWFFLYFVAWQYCRLGRENPAC